MELPVHDMVSPTRPSACLDWVLTLLGTHCCTIDLCLKYEMYECLYVMITKYECLYVRNTNSAAILKRFGV